MGKDERGDRSDRLLDGVEERRWGLDEAQIGLDRRRLDPARRELLAQPTRVGRLASPGHGLVVGPPESRRHIPAGSGKSQGNGRADAFPPASPGDQREGSWSVVCVHRRNLLYTTSRM